MILRHKLVALSAIALFSTAALAQELPQLPNSSGVGFRMRLPGGSYLGVQTENVSSQNFAKYNLREPRGVGVTRVVENSPAAKAGLQKGDVIIRFEGEEVKSEGKLLRLISEVAPDQKATLTVLRNGAEMEISVTMGKREEPQIRAFGNGDGMFIPAPPGELRQLRVPPIPSIPPMELEGFDRFPNEDGNFFIFGRSGRKLGVTVSPLSKQLGDYFGTADGKGVLVDEVKEASAAAKAGLRAGDVILEIDGEAINSSADLIRALNKKNEGDVTLTVLRDKQRLTLRATPEGKKETPPTTPSGTKFRI